MRYVNHAKKSIAVKDFQCGLEHHCTYHYSDYDVCSHWLCRIAWFAERWLWYGGEA